MHAATTSDPSFTAPAVVDNSPWPDGAPHTAGCKMMSGWRMQMNPQRPGSRLSMLWVDKSAESHFVSVADEPTYAMNVIGCTKAMGSCTADNSVIPIAAKKGRFL